MEGAKKSFLLKGKKRKQDFRVNNLNSSNFIETRLDLAIIKRNKVIFFSWHQTRFSGKKNREGKKQTILHIYHPIWRIMVRHYFPLFFLIIIKFLRFGMEKKELKNHDAASKKKFQPFFSDRENLIFLLVEIIVEIKKNAHNFQLLWHFFQHRLLI